MSDEWRDGTAIIFGNLDMRPGFVEPHAGVIVYRDPGDEHDNDHMRWMMFVMSSMPVLDTRHAMPSPRLDHDPGDEDHVEIIGQWWWIRGALEFRPNVVS